MSKNYPFDPRWRDWCQESGVYWDNWSRNGEVFIVGLDPPFTGGARLANFLTWLVRGFASRSRRTHDVTGAFDAAYTSPRMPSPLYIRLSLSLDLTIRDSRLIRERVRQRGGDPAACRWPALWLEGMADDYLIGPDPFPPGGWPRGRIVILAEERQVFVPAKGAKLTAGARTAWKRGLDAFAGVDGEATAGLSANDEQAFLLNILVLVHTWPAAKPQPRTPLEVSYKRHEALIAELAPSALKANLPLAWHALWRLPPAMTWSEPGQKPWMRYPAVSFAAAVRPV